MDRMPRRIIADRNAKVLTQSISLIAASIGLGAAPLPPPRLFATVLLLLSLPAPALTALRRFGAGAFGGVGM